MKEESNVKYYNEPTNNDMWIVDLYKGKKGGYFFEAGAQNGISGSCTYTLEKYFDWRGILVEPGIYFKNLVKNRPNSICENLCISEENGKVIFIDTHNGGHSGIKNKLIRMEEKHLKRWGTPKDQWRKLASRERMVESITLYNLFKKHNAPEKIDYLALDIEGSEYDTLKNFPFNKYKIMAISIEGDSCNDLLNSKGYVKTMNRFNTEGPWESYFIHKNLLKSL